MTGYLKFMADQGMVRDALTSMGPESRGACYDGRGLLPPGHLPVRSAASS
jgi:hypothetical protein